MATDGGVLNEGLVYPGVRLGLDSVVEPGAIVGKPSRNGSVGEQETQMGDRALIRPFTTIYAGVTTGRDFQTGQGACVREDNVIGDDVSVGTNAVLEPGNRIGNRVRIHTGCFLEYVTVEDDVFIAPNVVFADDLHPP